MALPQITVGDGMLGTAMLASVEIAQQLNSHWWCTITCRETEETRLPAEDMLGKAVKIVTTDEQGTSHTHFAGFVYDVELDYEVWGSYSARILAVSKSYLLDHAANKHYYPDATLASVTSEVGGRNGVSITANAPGRKPLNYVQYGETDFDFVHRIADDYGAWFRPTDDGIEILSAFTAGTSVTWREHDGLTSFSLAARLAPAAVSGAHYDHHAMLATNPERVQKQPEFYDGGARLTQAAVAAAQALPPGFEPTRARAMTNDDYHAQLEAESERNLGSAIVGRGRSQAQPLRAGDIVQIQGTLDAAGTYGLTRVVHRWTPQGYENEFECTPWKSYRSPSAPKMHVWEGVVPARVIDHNDPKKMGRLRLKFFWQDDTEAHWARMVSPHAGPDRGMMMMPEVGDEVAVMFEDGDPERPVIVGSVWNGVQQAPRAGFFSPEGDVPDNNVKRLLTKAGNRLQIVDTPTLETITFATPSSSNLTLTEKHTATGRPTVHLHSDGDILLTAPQGRVHIQGKFYSREVGAQTSAKANAATVPAKKVASSSPAAPLATLNAPAGGKNDLCLGKNAQYADAMNAAAKRTGTDPAALAAFVNAEAAKDKNGVWNPDSAASKSSATGLMQFLSGTWKGMATSPGTALNQAATQQGLVTGSTNASGKTTYSVANGKEGDLLALRNDPQLSLTTGAEYLKQNEQVLASNNLIPANATDAEKVQLGYIAHHEGSTGAVEMLQGKIPESKLDSLMNSNMSAAQRAKYLKANGNDKQAAYRAFVKDYAKKKVNPDRFRCSKQQQLTKLTQAQDAARNNPNNQPNQKLGTTYCNVATTETVKAAGAPTGPFVDKNGNPVLANQASKNLANSSEYTEVTPEQAQTYADNGGVAVGAYDNPGGHGHLVTVRPDNITDQPDLPGSGPLLNNVGSKVGVMHSSQVFRPTADVHYYVPSGG